LHFSKFKPECPNSKPASSRARSGSFVTNKRV
jgi:hypothetical protein